jgi:hypothetical protein
MAAPVPASRNALCPCGSGRRYKVCHGALKRRVGSAAAGVDAQAARRAALMHEALELQQAGDIAGAISRYEAVLADDAANFDALHMLGVAYYQSHALEPAERTLRKAIAREPDVAAAQQNLALVVEARRFERAEDALCREVLPRLAHLCAPPDEIARALERRERIDVLMGARHAFAGDAILKRIAEGVLGPARLHAVPARTSRAATLRLDAPIVLVHGVDETLATWGELADDATRMLVVTRDAPSRVHDRLGELSGHGRHRVHLCYAARDLREAIGLPGPVLFERDASRSRPTHRRS